MLAARRTGELASATRASAQADGPLAGYEAEAPSRIAQALSR
jgi:hypothetical protein